VLKRLVQKTADPADNSFNIQKIFNEVSGGKTEGLNVQGMVTRFKRSIDKDGDGEVDFQDLKSILCRQRRGGRQNKRTL
jgi:hypothetical protein